MRSVEGKGGGWAGGVDVEEIPRPEIILRQYLSLR